MAIKVLANTGEIIDFNETKTHEKDTRSLCGAKHDVTIGITKMSDKAQPVPFEDYIVVHFQPYDTSGGGEAMLKMQEAVKGSTLFLTDGDAYNDALAAGREGAQNKYNDCVAEHGRWACTGVLAETGAYTGISAVGSGAGYVASGLFNVGKSIGEATCFWCAEEYAKSPLTFAYEDFGEIDYCKNPDDPRCGDEWGTAYHGAQGNTHKVRITITNTFEGKTVTRYRHDLSGCAANYDDSLGFCYNGETYKRFLINSPGTWTVKVEPIATASCEALAYTETATYEIAKPEGWEPSPIQTLSTDVSVALQEAGVPVAVTPVQLVIGGSLVGGLVIYKLLKRIKARRE